MCIGSFPRRSKTVNDKLRSESIRRYGKAGHRRGTQAPPHHQQCRLCCIAPLSFIYSSPHFDRVTLTFRAQDIGHWASCQGASYCDLATPLPVLLPSPSLRKVKIRDILIATVACIHLSFTVLPTSSNDKCLSVAPIPNTKGERNIGAGNLGVRA